MKRIWTIVSVLAVANLLALAGFVGWLATTDRLDAERVRELRELLGTTRAAQREAAAGEAARLAAEAQAVAERTRLEGSPETAEETIARDHAESELVHQQSVRLAREVNDLKRTLDRDRSRLDEESRALAVERARFEAERTRIRETEGTAQFQTAVATLAAQKPAEARGVLQALIDQSNVEQAVAYLAAMDDRARSRVMGEFIRGDPRLAADLLERLRTRGVVSTPGDASPPR